MRDLAEKIMMRELEIPKIHGEVDIRLKNPMTGKIVKQIKGENTFQSAILAKGLRNLGTGTASLYNSLASTEMPWQRIVGGIFLFKNSLSNAQYMPKGNRMQANGSYGVTNNGNPTELGSWNSNESSASSNSLLLVYDWTTSQANGAGGISSVALTSQVGGYIGYGNPSETHASTVYEFNRNVGWQNVQRRDFASDSRKVQTGNKFYQFTYDSTEKKLNIRKSRVPVTQGSVFDWLYDDIQIDVSSLHYNQVVEGWDYWVTLFNGKMYIIGGTSYGTGWAAGAKKYVWEYNPTNDAITELEFTNSTGSEIRYNWGSVAQGLLFVYSDTKTHVFKLSDYSYVGYIENHGTGTPANSVATGTDFSGGLVYIPDNINPGSGGLGRIYDPDNRTCYPTNGMVGIGNQYQNMYYDPETDTLNIAGRDNMLAWNNPLYLATNYNLPSSVQKDASMTMQVRYTLTEA